MNARDVGAVRLRSNVVVARDGSAPYEFPWELVPGDLVETFKPGYLRNQFPARSRQRDEKGYYLSCTVCGRKSHQIFLEGCDLARCSAPPSPARVELTRARRGDALAHIALELAHIADASRGTEEDELPPIVGAEEAATRLLHQIRAPDVVDGPLPAVAPAPKVETPLQQRAVRGLRIATEGCEGFDEGYAADPIGNLVDSLQLGQARRALHFIAQGDGAELEPGEGGRAKFCAAHSSCALAVNTFAAWIGREEALAVGDFAGFRSISFEAKFPTGLQGKPPNLDVYLQGPAGHLAIESKCTEHLSTRSGSFQPSYDKLVDEIAHESWSELFRGLKSGLVKCEWLDAGQLVRHYLGLKRAVLNGTAESIGLGYVYWEPDGTEMPDGLRQHEAEVSRLAAIVADPEVPFIARSYRQLWTQWVSPEAPAWQAEHVAALRRRYDVSLAFS